jgi:hypothetical protein
MNKLYNEYFKTLCDKIVTQNENKENKENKEKMSNENIIMPKFNEYHLLTKYNYNLTQLMMIKKKYKLKINKNKNKKDINLYIYCFLYYSVYALKIQKLFRGHLLRQKLTYHGPMDALKNHNLCINKTDFLSMDDLETISNSNFFCFCDDEGFIYGFDILTFYNLLYTNKTKNENIKNPYNNQLINATIIEKFERLILISRLLKIPLITEIKHVNNNISEKKAVEMKTLEIFHNIDLLGNYSNTKWFLDLNKRQLIFFIRGLINIWGSNLSQENQILMCPPHGNPFINLPSNVFNVLNAIENIYKIKMIILNVLDNIINNNATNEYKAIGAYYILAALSLVNPEVATALPWLHQAVLTD